MRPYETLVVLSTGLGDEDPQLLARFEGIIAAQGGTLDERRDWGVRDLAYPIRKQKQGHFVLIEYQAEPEVVKELERNLRISEGVLRFVSVQQEHTGLPEPRQRESYDRRDVPLSEMRSSDGGPDSPQGGPAESGQEGESAQETPAAAENSEQVEG